MSAQAVRMGLTRCHCALNLIQEADHLAFDSMDGTATQGAAHLHVGQ